MRYVLSSDSALIVHGPASIRLLRGDATALSAPVENRKLVVRRERQLPIETTSKAELEVVLGESAHVFEVKGSTIPSSWHSGLQALVEMGRGKVLIVGASDTGKSTLTTFLANGLVRKRITPRIVDADIGQADIGPPTTVSTAVVPHCLASLADATPTSMIFVGHTSPSRVRAKLTNAISRLSEFTQESLTLINTDGWVLDPEAVIYKIELIEAIQPDLVLGIARGAELEPILRGARTPSMRIEASKLVLERSQSDRRQIRTAGYRRFLDGGNVISYPKLKTKVKLPAPLTSIQAEPAAMLRNLIVGLLDRQGVLLQLGVLLNLDENTLRVYSRPADPFTEIELGYVKLAPDGTELGYLDP